MGTSENIAWLGSQPEPGMQATVNRLVAGDLHGAYALTEPLDSYVLEVAPVVEPAGIRTTYLLRGIFAGNTWARFEIVEVAME